MSVRTHLPLTSTFLDGLLMLTNAVPDSALVIDCANCGADKFSMIGGQHDFMSSTADRTMQPRVRYSDLKANDMVLGTERRMRETIRDIVSSRGASVVFVVQSSAVVLIGTDEEALAEEMEEELGIPVAVVPPQPLNGDVMDGLDSGLEVLARKLSLPSKKTDAERVGIVGYVLERLEADQLANIAELRRMVSALGLEVGSCWLDGSPVSELAAIAGCGTLLALPHGRKAARALARRTGAEVVDASLPVGLDGSVRWVTALGERLGRQDAARAFVDEELATIVPRLDRAVRRTFMERHAAVVGDPHLAVAMTEYLTELGMAVPLVVVLARRHAAVEGVRQALEGSCESPELLEDPTFPQVEAAFGRLREGGRLDVAIGSGSARDAAKFTGLPFLEISHPCYVRHALFDAPWIGLRGALWLADALFNTLNRVDYERY